MKTLNVVNFQFASEKQLHAYLVGRRNAGKSLSVVTLDETPVDTVASIVETVYDVVVLGAGTTIKGGLEYCEFFGVDSKRYVELHGYTKIDGYFSEEQIKELSDEFVIFVVEE